MNDNIIIREYIPADYEQVSSLWEITGMGGKARGDDNVTIERCELSGAKLFILEDTSKSLVVGTSWLTNDARRIYLHHFGILPEYQGQGLSQMLLKASFDYAKEMGMQIKLEVHKENEIAVNLYQKSDLSFNEMFITNLFSAMN